MASIDERTAVLQADNERLIEQNRDYTKLRDLFAGHLVTLGVLTLLERDAELRQAQLLKQAV